MDEDIQWIREEPNQSTTASQDAIQFTIIPQIKTVDEPLKDCEQVGSHEDHVNGITVDPIFLPVNSISIEELTKSKEASPSNEVPVDGISYNETAIDAVKVPEIVVDDTPLEEQNSAEIIFSDDIPVASSTISSNVTQNEEPKSAEAISDNTAPVDAVGSQQENDKSSGITVDPIIQPTAMAFEEVSDEKAKETNSANETPNDGVKKEDDGSKQAAREQKDEEIQWIREEADEKTLDISEIEKELERNTREARALVEELGRKAERTDANNKRIHEELAAQRALLTGIGLGLHKTIEDEVQLPQYSQLPSGGLPFNVESVLIADGMMDINAAIILPNGLVLITNSTSMNLFNIQGQVVKKLEDPAWTRPRSPVYHKEHILVLVDYDIGGGQFRRFIFKFTLDLNFVARIEGPKWLEDKHVLRDKMAVAHTDYLYLAACGRISSAIYELSPVGQWTELDFKQSESYVDIVAFATIGPITQLLVVENNRHYVIQLSVRESEIVDRRKMAICQRPGAIAKDDAGRLFVANYGTASIQLVDTVRWVSNRNIAVAESPIQFFSACWGLVAMPVKGAIRLLKYSFR